MKWIWSMLRRTSGTQTFAIDYPCWYDDNGECY